MIKNNAVYSDILLDLSEKEQIFEYSVNDVKIQKLVLKKKKYNKEKGTYITINFREEDIIKKDDIIKICLRRILKELKKTQSRNTLVIGLGNSSSLIDSLGPYVLQSIIITRHITKMKNKVSILKPEVIGTTGIDSSEIIKGVIKEIKPDLIIVIDSLISLSLNRLCKTIQVTDTGIIPGSGVGSNKFEISYEKLKIPVIAIGVPTIISGYKYIEDMTNTNMSNKKKLLNSNLIVTNKDIDLKIENLAIIIATAINEFLLHK